MGRLTFGPTHSGAGACTSTLSALAANGRPGKAQSSAPASDPHNSAAALRVDGQRSASAQHLWMRT